MIKKLITNENGLSYNFICSASGTDFIRTYAGKKEISDALNEILHQDWFFDCETNDVITEDKLLEISNIPVFNVYYRNLPNVYELLICDADNKQLFTADIADWDEFFKALFDY